MGVVTKIRDGLANLMTGAGTTADKRAYGFYTLAHLDPAQAEAAYRTSWLVRKIVDLPAEDMTREWRDWQAEKAQIEALEAEEERLQLPFKVYRALVLSRLHGGGALYLGTGDADPSQPIDPKRITKGGLRFVHLFSRHELSHGEKRLDPEDPWFGHPEYFEINTRRTGMSPRIHPSRMVCFVGQPVPEGSLMPGASWFWGDPIMQSIEDAVKNADQAQNGFASLIDEAAVDTISIPDLMSSIASAEYEARMMRRLELSKMGQSVHRSRLMDANEKWETRQISWAGIPEIISTFLNIVAGAADIPVTRLLGQSPKGLQSTGSGEERDYIYMIMAKQKRDLAPALMGRIDALLIPSALGKRPSEVYSLFAPLMQSDPKQLADIEKLAAETVDILSRTGLVPDLALAKATINRMVESGQWPGLDEAVDKVKLETELAARNEAEEDDPSEIVPVEQPRRRAANDAREAVGGDFGLT